MLATVGRRAEEIGFAAIWVGDRAVMFDRYESKHPYYGDVATTYRGIGVLDQFVCLTWLAAATSTIRLGTGVTVVPERNPVQLAKSVASLDWLSGGRVDFGVGLGWAREEYAALGVPWAGRGRNCDDRLRLMKRLWTEELIDGYRADPKPLQRPHPPVHVAGESDAALRRVAALGDGWYGVNVAVDALPERLAALDEALAAAGRSRADVTVTVGRTRTEMDVDDAGACRDLGVDQLVVTPRGRGIDELLDSLDRIARELEVS
jgi:probable F420-dependent oxidoreductase